MKWPIFDSRLSIDVIRSLSVFLAIAAIARAQSGGGYVIRKGAMDGGGVTFHTGANYRLGGTVGQHDTASLTGGNYVLNGGFWTPGMLVEVPTDPQPDPSGINKTRFISFVCPFGMVGETAIRVTLLSLHHVEPPYTGGPSVPFTSFEGQIRWVGPPAQYVESSADPTPFYASSLQCTPLYRDWVTVGLLHVTGSAIVPNSVYSVEAVGAPCIGQENTPSCLPGGWLVSRQIQIKTTRWGDVETPYTPPNPSGQPDFGDISALVNKFKSQPGAPIKARALLIGDDAFGNISPNTMSLDFSFTHIAACVDAFKGKPYPHTIQACP